MCVNQYTKSHEARATVAALGLAQGEPKAIPWTHVTPLRCAADGWAHQDIQPGQVSHDHQAAPCRPRQVN